jgi:hypothetical protein
MDSQVLKSYLVSLGWQVDQPALSKFEDALRISGQQAEKFTTGIAKDFTVAGTSIVATLTAVATGVIGLADSTAAQDLKLQLFARSMFMGADAARYMKTSLDALGITAQEAVFGPPELQRRYRELVQLQKDLDTRMGGAAGIEKGLVGIRDVRQEFTKLQVAATELARGFSAGIYNQLFGGEEGQKRLDALHNWVLDLIDKVPALAQELSTSLSPVLKNVFDIWKELADIAQVTTGWALKFVGAIYSDGRLEQGTVTIKNIGLALEHVSATMKTLIGYVEWLVNAINAHPIIAKTLGGALAGGAMGSIIPGAGTGAGAAIGGAIGFTAGVGSALGAFSGNQQDIKALIANTAKQLGLDPALALAIGSHESGFRNVPNAQGSGAFGPLQLMPGTAQRYGVTNLQDPNQSVPAALQLLRDLLAKHGGDVGAALKDYGGFITKDPSGYINDIERRYKEFAPQYHPSSYSGKGIDVGGISVTVHVASTNATPEQIAHAVKTAMDDSVRRNLIGLSGVYV